jgi:hypothetical protein
MTCPSCGVRFPLLRTCARQTGGRMSSQPPRFQWLGQNQASSDPGFGKSGDRASQTGVARPEAVIVGFVATTGPSSEPTFDRSKFLSYEII